MIEREDQEAIAQVVLEMIDERVTAPLEKLFDCLLMELIAQDSVDVHHLSARLESLWTGMPDHEREGCGRIYNRYRRLLSNPQALATALRPPDASDPRSEGRKFPEWYKGLLQGGAHEGSAKDEPDGGG